MFKKFSLILIICLFYNQIAFSAASGGSEKDDGGNEGKISKFKEGHKLVLSGKYLEKKADKFKKKGKIEKAEKSLAKAKKKYERAFKKLLESSKEKPNEPNTLNYLGFTSRKLGNFEDAEKYYLAGLKIEPNHNGINEYLGELYLNTNRKQKAIERLNVLKSCNCKEYTKLKEIIDGERTSKY